MFPQLLDMTVRMIQRGERPFLPPFENVALRPGDVVIVAATRTVLTEALQDDESMLHIDLPANGDTGNAGSDEQSGELVLAEAMVAPGSRLIGQTIAEARLLEASGAMVLGVERRARMIRITLDDIRLASGDVLLLLAPREKLRRLRQNRNLITLGGTFATLPDRRKALKAQLVFLLTVLAAASGLVPIVTAALMGAIAMILTGILTLRQSARAFDRKIYMLIGAAMAMATALQATGGAAYIASLAAGLLNGQSPAVMLSGFFLMIAILTNILSNHATAALFTPIAVTTASQLGADPVIFLHAVILAANCSFATPMAYQTNLLVMGPGHYRFSDFLRAGGPLVVLLWLSYSLIAPWYYGL
jgi:di/tricarboxylate transporter